MSEVPVLANTAVAIVGIVVLIVRFRVNPVISLVVGSLYLGLATGLGVTRTIRTITTGFGDIMAEVGLLIAFGVLMGAVLQETGAIEQLVDRLLHVFGPRRLPHSMALTIGTLLQAIYLDVLLVICAPLARTASRRIGPLGSARMGAALAIGLESGIVLMVPGVGALALAALLHVPLGTMLLWGLVLIVPTVLVSVTIMSFLFRRGLWNSATDEDAAVASETAAPAPPQTQKADTAEPARVRPVPAVAMVGGTPAPGPAGPGTRRPGRPAAGPAPGPAGAAVPCGRWKDPPLLVRFAPLVTALLMIGGGAVAQATHTRNPVLSFVSSPVVALLTGLVGTLIVARLTVGRERVERALVRGFKDSGQILILTAVGGSLAAVVGAGGLGRILRGYFSTGGHIAPLLLVWAVAAALHLAVGSVTISAITTAGILAPIAPGLGLDPVLVALAIGAGSLFAVHVTSNTFWLLQSLMGQTTRGTLKSCTLGVSVASVVAVLLLLPLSLFL
ncbi:GntP family permease [Actinacidiphila glaucinigra]|uniref:H+/gluconate symporter n=2 Tax=Actinacidiphila glaucinigra TaxID=235986 RepID=A0A239MZ76_9ACTN|nr:SLC13 family permease [Actinacidiphila glaucinigra]SNT47810.1 H+/gluconate symporter [Actinacidiphila glaucinigra]